MPVRHHAGVKRRALAWAIVPPLVAAGVECAHTLAYAALGVPAGPAHEYLVHGPELLAVSLLLGLACLGSDRRPARPAPLPFLALALGLFALQEHVERLAHAGRLPFLLASPLFLLGLALQVPFALAAWLVARWLLAGPVRARPARPPLVPWFAVALAAVVASPVVAPEARAAVARAPPAAS